MKLKVIAILLLFSGITGCATRSDMDALYQRIVILENKNRALYNRNQTAQTEIGRLRDSLEKYDVSWEEKDKGLRGGQADLQATIDRFREEVLTLNGKLEETDYLLKKTVDRFDKYESRTENRVTRLERFLNVEGPVRSGQSPVSRTTPRTQPSDPVVKSDSRRDSLKSQANELFSEMELYNLAKEAFDREDYVSAREGFLTLINKYPKSKNADNAQFWIGDSYFREKMYDRAILEYQIVTEKYPKGNKVRAAMLKMGLAFYNMGDTGNARTILEEVLIKYPDSEEAQTAARRLEAF